MKLSTSTYLMVLVVVSLVGAAKANAQDGVVTNPLSAFDITTDGLFTGGVVNGVVMGEWSDVTPQGYVSPPSGSSFADLRRTPPGTPNALTYAAVAPGIISTGDPDGLYLMYAYEPRTDTTFDVNEFIADVFFPMVIDECGDGCIRERNIRVVFRGASAPANTDISPAAATIPGQIPIDSDGNGVADSFSSSFYRIEVFADVDGNPNTGENGFERQIDVQSTGMEGAIGFGRSPLSDPLSLPHLLVELEVPLLINASEVTDPNSPFAGGVGGPTGYSPDPVFWGASVANDLVDPPASAGIVNIDVNTGATTLDSRGVQPVPEPCSSWCVGCGLLVFTWRRWMASSADCM